MTVALPSILLALLFALNVPVAFAIAISALSFFFLADGLPMDIFFQKMVSAESRATRCWRCPSSSLPAA